jgi:hypothetical protein
VIAVTILTITYTLTIGETIIAILDQEQSAPDQAYTLGLHALIPAVKIEEFFLFFFVSF